MAHTTAHGQPKIGIVIAKEVIAVVGVDGPSVHWMGDVVVSKANEVVKVVE